MDPFTIAAGINAGASVLNGIFGNRSVKSTNKANLQIARETNENQLKMMREQNQFNYDTAKEFFNMENEYNSPAATRQRLEAAGLNPFVAMGQGQAAFANGDAATPTASGLPSLASPTIQPAPSILNGVLPEIANTMKTFAEAKKLGIDTKYYEDQVSEELRSIKLDNLRKDFDLYIDKIFVPEERQSALTGQDLQNDLTGQNLNKVKEEINNLIQDYQNKQKQGEILDIQKAKEDILKRIAKIDESYASKLKSAELDNLLKQGNLIVENTAYTRRQRNLLGKTINGVEVDKDTLQAYVNTIRKETNNKSLIADVENLVQQMNKQNMNDYTFRLIKRISQYADELPLVNQIIKVAKGMVK